MFVNENAIERANNNNQKILNWNDSQLKNVSLKNCISQVVLCIGAQNYTAIDRAKESLREWIDRIAHGYEPTKQ